MAGMAEGDAAVPSPCGVGHVHLNVRELERSVEFYTEVLGLEVAERVGRFAFLSWGGRHHDVALQAVGEDAPSPSRGVGLYHVSLEVDDPAALVAIYDRLRERDVVVSPVDHHVSKSLYFDDPDGNGLEVTLDTREENGCAEWAGENRPFDPHDLPGAGRAGDEEPDSLGDEPDAVDDGATPDDDEPDAVGDGSRPADDRDDVATTGPTGG